jgi:hypothetical protein
VVRPVDSLDDAERPHARSRSFALGALVSSEL